MKVRFTLLALAIVATLGVVALGAGFAPAAIDAPEPPVFERRPLPLEWNGVRPDPDVDRMFRRGAPQRPHLDDMFRKR
jgi:hypothetical protein